MQHCCPFIKLISLGLTTNHNDDDKKLKVIGVLFITTFILQGHVSGNDNFYTQFKTHLTVLCSRYKVCIPVLSKRKADILNLPQFLIYTFIFSVANFN